MTGCGLLKPDKNNLRSTVPHTDKRINIIGNILAYIKNNLICLFGLPQPTLTNTQCMIS